MDEHRDLWWPSPTVEHAQVVPLPLEAPLSTELGAEIPQIQVAFESWGALSADRDNAILVIHPMTADCHATGDFQGQALGWWEPLIGPGRAIDTNRYFVVCPNLIGGCYGTTGPRFPGPEGKPWLDGFPLLTPRDMVRVQRMFCDALGLEHLRLVIGPSMGGMLAWEWAIEGGANVDSVVVIAAPLRATPYHIGLNWLQRRGIELDFSEDDYVARWGQMVARGIGMLSYRSPVGLEEKFGRDWFKRPGSVLRERGMFNVESWLRHHGKKITKRFDPYTWILYSRAMDLHDISEGRGGMLAALDRVKARVVVVGISSDALYSATEVHVGADILRHLGKQVEYREIRSPHGHDAFMLEFDQLTSILHDAAAGVRGAVPTPAERELRLLRLGILGAGQVASDFVQLLEERREQLLAENRLRVEIAEIAEIDPSKRIPENLRRYPLTHDPQRLVSRSDIDVVVEVTRGTNVEPLVRQALSAGRLVLTPNKALVHNYAVELESLALESGSRIAYHNSVAAGWPLLFAVQRPLARDKVTSIRAMLSSTVNVILEVLEEGGDLAAGIARARELGVTEDDPELDISGWDSAQKLSILISRALARRVVAEGIPRIGIADLSPALCRAAPDLGLRVKFAAIFERDEGDVIASVQPIAVPAEGHLGSVRADNNVVVLDGGLAGEMVQIGGGAGSLPVAAALVRDLVGLIDPALTWTGRYPRLERSPKPPEFLKHLVEVGASAEIRDDPAPGSVPVLESLRGSPRA